MSARRRSQRITTGDGIIRTPVASGGKLTVLENVTNDTELVEVAAATLSTERLLECNLDVADGVLVPAGAERNVGKAEHEDVLDHLLPEIMIDTERLVLCPVLLEGSQKLAAGLEVLAERLFYNDTVLAILGVALLLEVLSNRNEDAGREGEVEETVALLGLVFRLDVVHNKLVEVLERRRVLVAARDVEAELLELLELRLAVRIVVGDLDVRGDALVVFGIVHLGTSIAYDVDIARQEAHAVETEEGGICLGTVSAYRGAD